MACMQCRCFRSRLSDSPSVRNLQRLPLPGVDYPYIRCTLSGYILGYSGQNSYAIQLCKWPSVGCHAMLAASLMQPSKVQALAHFHSSTGWLAGSVALQAPANNILGRQARPSQSRGHARERNRGVPYRLYLCNLYPRCRVQIICCPTTPRPP